MPWKATAFMPRQPANTPHNRQGMTSITNRMTATDLLCRLVSCPSVNPGSPAMTGNRLGEGAMSEFLDALLQSWGARTHRIEYSPGRWNTVAVWQGKNKERSLLLDAHMDTVGIEGMTIPPFEPQLRDGRLYGRGACDTKGPMAAMLMAIRRILDSDGALPVTLHFAATGDEEDGATGVTHLLASGMTADAAIVAEPTGLNIVYTHKGACRFRVRLHGKAAHSSVPWLGVNAVTAAAEMIHAIQNDFIRRIRYQSHPALGMATVCVSTIRGGTRVNVVPDYCEFDVDCRCLPGEKRDDLANAMGGLLDTIAADIQGLQAKCDIFQWYPALSGCECSPFLSRMAVACQKVAGPCTTSAASYATHGGFYSQAGIPCIVCGPGSIAQAHTADEYIDLDQLQQAVNIYEAMIRASAFTLETPN